MFLLVLACCNGMQCDCPRNSIRLQSVTHEKAQTISYIVQEKWAIVPIGRKQSFILLIIINSSSIFQINTVNFTSTSQMICAAKNPVHKEECAIWEALFVTAVQSKSQSSVVLIPCECLHRNANDVST